MAFLPPVLVAYVLGGFTFLPLVLALIFLHAYLTFPVRESDQNASDASRADQTSAGNTHTPPEYPDDLPPELKKRVHEPDVAAGYFAVTREFVPGGVNGKPPERTTPVGAAHESPSVYQSMYRSIFDWGKAAAPSMEAKAGTSGGRQTKKIRNVFFVVLRHGHLMLYDDSEQVEVRHVISLAHHTIDVYAGGEAIPEGELWIKRNCIRLKYSGTAGELQTKPFYLFSENCSDKEDFYHALLQNKDRTSSTDTPAAPTPLKFEPAHIIKLVQSLHASEDYLQHRWLNALIGRLFLALYKTQDVEDFIRMKFTKKIARVPKPNFISHIKLQKVSMGDSGPSFTHPKLRELTVDGDLTVEADVHYAGNFRIEIAATARIDLGPRFKAREVSLILAGICKKLSGHILLRIKPPPSNRIWISFETMPQIDMSIEPIVSSRQITYGVVLRAIESRIREVIGETVVYPNWDDIPFHDSREQDFRGGIWVDEQHLHATDDAQTKAAKAGLVDQFHDAESGSEEEVEAHIEKEKSMSTPALASTLSPGLAQRRGASKTVMSLDESATTSATDKTHRRPKAMRSNSFATAASPVLNVDSTTTKAEKISKDGYDAATGLKDISSRSPVESPVGSMEDKQDSLMERMKKQGSFSSNSSQGSQKSKSNAGPPDSGTRVEMDNVLAGDRDVNDSGDSDSASSAQPESGSLPTSTASTPGLKHRVTIPDPRNLASIDKRATIDAGIGTMTAAAKKFFANRRNNGPSQIPTSGPGTPDSSSAPATPSSMSSLFKASQEALQSASPARPPMGRGQPLPPPGTPLPHPKSKGWHASPLTIGSITGIGFAKRKPSIDSNAMPPRVRNGSDSDPPPLPARPGQEEPKSNGARSRSSQRSVTTPQLPPRRRRSEVEHKEPSEEAVVVIEAPEEDEVVGSMELDTEAGNDKEQRSDSSVEKEKAPPQKNSHDEGSPEESSSEEATAQ